MKKTIKFSRAFFINFLKNIDVYIGGLFFGVMVVLVFVNVLMRYIFHLPFYGAEELISIMFAWTTYLGIISCFRFDRHTRLDFFYNMMPKLLQKILDISIDIASLIFFINFTYRSFELCANVGLKRTLALRLNFNVFNIVLLICFGAMTVLCMFKIYHKLKGDYMVENPLADVEAAIKDME